MCLPKNKQCAMISDNSQSSYAAYFMSYSSLERVLCYFLPSITLTVYPYVRCKLHVWPIARLTIPRLEAVASSARRSQRGLNIDQLSYNCW